jgi:biopolymer transport protein TolR
MQTAKERLQSNRLISNIDAIGFSAVMLVVLFILMTPFMMWTNHSGRDADLAKVGHPLPMPDAARDDAILIAMRRDGHVYVGNGEVEPSQLSRKIQDRVKLGSPQIVYFKVDARTKYRYVEDALDAVRTCGLEKIVFLAETAKKQSPVKQ